MEEFSDEQACLSLPCKNLNNQNALSNRNIEKNDIHQLSTNKKNIAQDQAASTKPLISQINPQNDSGNASLPNSNAPFASSNTAVYNNCHNVTNVNGTITPGGLTAHYYSPILNTPQSLLRPLMTTQPPLYSPMLPSQQHSYALPHPSPSAGSFSSLAETVRSLEPSLPCTSEPPFKDVSNSRLNEEGSNNSDKSCSMQTSKQYNAEVNQKRANMQNSCSLSRFPSCAETATKNTNLHEQQQAFEDYVRLYGEDTGCRSWGGESSSSHRGSSYSNHQSGTGFNMHGFSDCRLDPSWNRYITGQSSNCLSEPYSASDQSSSLTVKHGVKGYSGSLNTTNHMTSPSVSENNVSRSHYEYQAISAGQFASLLTYMQPVNYQQPQCRGSESRQNENPCGIENNETQTQNSNDNSKKQVAMSSVHINNGGQDIVAQNSNGTQSSLAMSTSSHIHNTSQIQSSSHSVSTFANGQHHISKDIHNEKKNGDISAQNNVQSTVGCSSASENKFQMKNSIQRGSMESFNKKQSNKGINEEATNLSNFCLLCGASVEDSTTHSLIDNLTTVPSKISVNEKLTTILGYPLPREMLPSQSVCPKCFHLINEVDLLEHRLNVCRREVLISLETMFERNGIHFNPYKRFQRQQYAGSYQHHEMQHSSYHQSLSSNVAQSHNVNSSHGVYQNDGQNYQLVNHIYPVHNQSNHSHFMQQSQSQLTQNYHQQNINLPVAPQTLVNQQQESDQQHTQSIVNHQSQNQQQQQPSLNNNHLNSHQQVSSSHPQVSLQANQLSDDSVKRHVQHDLEKLNLESNHRKHQHHHQQHQHHQQPQQQGHSQQHHHNHHHHHHHQQHQQQHSTASQNQSQHQQAHHPHIHNHHHHHHVINHQVSNVTLQPHFHLQNVNQQNSHNNVNHSQPDIHESNQIHLGHEQPIQRTFNKEHPPNNIYNHNTITDHSKVYQNNSNRVPKSIHNDQLVPIANSKASINQTEQQPVSSYHPHTITSSGVSNVENGVSHQTENVTQSKANIPQSSVLSSDIQIKEKASKCEDQDDDQSLLLETNNAIPLMLPETSGDLASHPMSVLLSYQQAAETSLSSELLVNSFDNSYSSDSSISNVTISQSHSSKALPESTEDISVSVAKGFSNVHNMNNETWSHCNDSTIENVNVSNSIASNHPECDIDIEECDNIIEAQTEEQHGSECVGESFLKVESSESGINSVSQQACTSSSFNAESDHRVLTDQVTSSENSELPCSTSATNDLNILLNPPFSPPPPPEGPPEGLRNVQDATEYHKPTLLGKNIKAKKHAKLQICRQCDQVFSNRQALIRHIERRHKNSASSFSCETCHKKFSSERAYEQHTRTHKTYPCKVCSKIFLKKSKFKQHLEEHSSKSLSCKVCNKETGSMQALISHLKTHDNPPKKYVCEICSKNFTCQRNLNQHSLIHSGEKPFSCENCGRGFRYKSNMVTHYNKCTGTYRFVCESCGKGFVLKSLYDRHVAEHEGRFAHCCSVCHKGFSKSSNLKSHFNKHEAESQVKLKPCTVCVNKDSRCNVIKSRGEIECEICGKRVYRKDTMKDHMSHHAGKRLHACHLCQKSFFYKANLNFHIKTVHYKKRPISCSSCGKSFSRPDCYKIHLRTHTGEKPYQCDSCGKAFSSGSNYKRHLKCHVTHARPESKDVDDD